MTAAAARAVPPCHRHTAQPVRILPQNRRRNPCAALQDCGMQLVDPLRLFQEWLAEARDREKSDPTAMALATADAAGRPAASHGALETRRRAGLCLLYQPRRPKGGRPARQPPRRALSALALLERQVRISGTVEPTSEAEADAYFATRPRLSQIGARASHHSRPMNGRYELEQAVAKEAMRFGVGAVPRPPFWSGFRVVPSQMEFWRQRPFRHHDRQRFTRVGSAWRHEWLFP